MRSLLVAPPRAGASGPFALRRTYLLPSVRHWVLLVAGLLTVLFAVDIALPTNAIRVWYWVRVVGPVQEAQFGFRSELSRDGHLLTIVSVTEGGLLHRAGVRPGWVSSQPSCFGFSQPQLLFEALRDAQRDHYPARLRFLEGDPRRYTTERWVLVHPAPPAS